MLPTHIAGFTAAINRAPRADILVIPLLFCFVLIPFLISEHISSLRVFACTGRQSSVFAVCIPLSGNFCPSVLFFFCFGPRLVFAEAAHLFCV